MCNMDLVKITLLFDIYGELLTDKQQDFFEDYYHDNLSLREIAEKNNISPQGVRDNLKRTEKILLNYEDKLEILEARNVLKSEVEMFVEMVENLEINANTKLILQNKVKNFVKF